MKIPPLTYIRCICFVAETSKASGKACNDQESEDSDARNCKIVNELPASIKKTSREKASTIIFIMMRTW